MRTMPAADVELMVRDIVSTLSEEFAHVDPERIICMRTLGSKSSAYARIWSLPKIWQLALNINTFYVLEVITNHFDKLPKDEQKKVVIHELMHIPKTFSGALVPHNFRWGKITDRRVNTLFKRYCKIKEEKQANDVNEQV